MSVLVIAGITVPLARSGITKKAPERVGNSSRAFAGNLRSTWRVEKRVWGVTTQWLTDSDAAAIEAAVALGAQVTCSGTLLPASLTCEVEVSDGQYLPLHGGSYRRTLNLTLREV